VTGPGTLPAELPVPEDDGAADHLPGLPLPPVELTSTGGGAVNLADLGRARARTVLYVYPMTGRPGVALPDGWNAIPGARGCTPEACGFRDHHADLAAAGAAYPAAASAAAPVRTPRRVGVAAQDTREDIREDMWGAFPRHRGAQRSMSTGPG